MKKNLCLVFILMLALGGCSPVIYYVDRQTTLEEDASLAWPKGEEELLKEGSSFKNLKIHSTKDHQQKRSELLKEGPQ